MVKFSRLLVLVLVLGCALSLPALAEEAKTFAAPETTALVVDFEEPLFTPMEGERQGVITVEELRRIHFLRACDPPEVLAYCPGCSGCIVSGSNVFCYDC